MIGSVVIKDTLVRKLIKIDLKITAEGFTLHQLLVSNWNTYSVVCRVIELFLFYYSKYKKAQILFSSRGESKDESYYQSFF